MGIDIDRETFERADYVRFEERLRENLAAFEELLRRPGFGEGPLSIGAELELSLIDERGLSLPRNRAVLEKALEPNLALELDRFNIEYNSHPYPLAGRPFAALEDEITAALSKVRRVAAEHGGRLAVIGILPTLGIDDLQPEALTQVRRFRALSAAVRRLRHAPFHVHIHGIESVSANCDDVTLEGANTSLQVHLRVPPDRFIDYYNAAQLAAAPAVAGSGNSPYFLGRRLWDETRIALFRQAVDERSSELQWRPRRVSFGQGWLRHSAAEPFAESVRMYSPLLPVVGDEDSMAAVRAGRVPELNELRLHCGTVWRWTRAVYDPGQGGSLRVEMRGLPSGPTPVDMMANAAFSIGLTLAMAPNIEDHLRGMPFHLAYENFHAAARHGLDAELYWPCESVPSPRVVRARELIDELAPLARDALTRAGVDEREAARSIGVFAGRAASGTTGARWQDRLVTHLEQRHARQEALRRMLNAYVQGTESGAPVHTWPVVP